MLKTRTSLESNTSSSKAFTRIVAVFLCAMLSLFQWNAVALAEPANQSGKEMKPMSANVTGNKLTTGYGDGTKTPNNFEAIRWDIVNGTLIIKPDNPRPDWQPWVCFNDVNYPWLSYKNDIEKVVTQGRIIVKGQTQYMFGSCENMKSCDVSAFRTEDVTLMNYMFKDCKSLESLDVSNLDTSKVSLMYNMFAGCSSLKEIDLTGMKLGHADIDQLFYNCTSLEKVNLTGIDTSNVSSMKNIFTNCHSLNQVTLGSEFKFKSDSAALPNGDWYSVNTGKFFGPFDIIDYRNGVADTYVKAEWLDNVSVGGVTLPAANDRKSSTKVSVSGPLGVIDQPSQTVEWQGIFSPEGKFIGGLTYTLPVTLKLEDRWFFSNSFACSSTGLNVSLASTTTAPSESCAAPNQVRVYNLSYTIPPTAASDLPRTMVNAAPKGSKAIKVDWEPVNGATGYEVYGAKCGDDFSLLATVGGNVNTYTQKKLKKDKSYKYYVKSFTRMGGTKVYLSQTYNVHISMPKHSRCNPKTITTNVTSLNLTKGQISKITAKVKGAAKKKQLTSHIKKVRFYSSNKSVATINLGNGSLTARGKGTCYLYAVSINGLRAKIPVTVS